MVSPTDAVRLEKVEEDSDRWLSPEEAVVPTLPDPEPPLLLPPKLFPVDFDVRDVSSSLTSSASSFPSSCCCCCCSS